MYISKAFSAIYFLNSKPDYGQFCIHFFLKNDNKITMSILLLRLQVSKEKIGSKYTLNNQTPRYKHQVNNQKPRDNNQENEKRGAKSVEDVLSIKY
jgi:hypothetical protein